MLLCRNCLVSPVFLPTNGYMKKRFQVQGAKKIIFTACHLGKLKLAVTSPDVISELAPNTF